ncbi:hypothetical protein DPMN_095044 [Dreissena polymorpha]|uniref:Uncharacterized protein n=1 Tax=Dreissena polymorpha TaxID=45954 RepID=A0A9D4L752_DREPO|nr:hypothetical protein DPMN_095044 [Dreissena polymorpha]
MKQRHRRKDATSEPKTGKDAHDECVLCNSIVQERQYYLWASKYTKSSLCSVCSEGATGMRYISYWGTPTYKPGSWRKRYKAGRSTDIDLKPLLEVFEKIDRINTGMSSRLTSRSQSTSSEESMPLKLNCDSKKQTNFRHSDDIGQRFNNNSRNTVHTCTSFEVTHTNNQTSNVIRSNVNDSKSETCVDIVSAKTCEDFCVKHNNLNTLETNFEMKNTVSSNECVVYNRINGVEEVQKFDRQDSIQIVEHTIKSSSNKSFVNVSYEEGLTTDECGNQMGSTADDIVTALCVNELNTDENIQTYNVFSDKETNTQNFKNNNANFISTAGRRKKVLLNDPVLENNSGINYGASTQSSSKFEAVYTGVNDNVIQDQGKEALLPHANREYRNKYASNVIKHVTNDPPSETSQQHFQSVNSSCKVKQCSEIVNTTAKSHADKEEDVDFNAFEYLKKRMESLSEHRKTVRRESFKTVTSGACRQNNVPVMHNHDMSTTRYDEKWKSSNDISYLLGSDSEDAIFDSETESLDEIDSQSTSNSLSASGVKWQPSLNLSSDTCDFSNDEDEIKDSTNTSNQNHITNFERNKTLLSGNENSSDTESNESETKSIAHFPSPIVDIDKKNKDCKTKNSNRVDVTKYWNHQMNQSPSEAMPSDYTNHTGTKYFQDETTACTRSTRNVKKILSKSEEKDPHDTITKLDVSREDENALNWRTRGYNTDFYMSRCSFTGGEILERYKNALTNRRRRDITNNNDIRTSKRSSAKVSRLAQMMKENLAPLSFKKQSGILSSRHSSRKLSTEQVKEVLQRAEACSTRMADRLSNQLGC